MRCQSDRPTWHILRCVGVSTETSQGFVREQALVDNCQLGGTDVRQDVQARPTPGRACGQW